MKLKISKKSKNFFFIFLFVFSFIIIASISIIGFNPYFEDETYIVSNDLIKNFKFDTFDGSPVSLSGQTIDQKLQFESQASWNIYQDDINLVDAYTIGDDAYIRYKVAMTGKVNMYSTLDVYQCAENEILQQVNDEYRIAKYQHLGLMGDVMHGWEEYLTWNHYDFGNIKQWNSAHNDFSGDLVMSFDIAQNLLPNFDTVSGDLLTKNFDYIAVSSIAVYDNVYGKLDDSVLDIVGITPRDYEEERNTVDNPTSDIMNNIRTKTRTFDAYYNPDISLNIPSTPLNSWDGGILPQTAGSSMNPRTKNGDPIWDPEEEQASMQDCKFIYHVGSLSPLVTEYYGTLSYHDIYYRSEDYWIFFPFSIGVRQKTNTQSDQSFTEPIALHCTNRYIQTTIRVVFDIFCSYKIDVGSDDIEDYTLDFPAEYYDLLLWLTTVDGFGGGETHTTAFGSIFGDIDIWTWIIVGIIAIAGIVIFIYVGVPIIKGRQRRKEIETIMKSRR
ncbi:MAG: hypothetical protein ACFFDF_01005 [Candidatus Odinarchaeota archaeon]